MNGEPVTSAMIRDLIPPGATVFLEQGACEPLTLHRALLDAAPANGIRLIAAPVPGLNECGFAAREAAERLRPTVFFSTPGIRESIRNGFVDYVPLHWSEVADAIRGRFQPDVALLQVSPPDEDGFCNLGANANIELAIALSAELIIAEINPRVPVVSGDTRLHQARIAAYVETQDELRPMRPIAWGQVEEEIATNVVDLLPEASTLQIGSGRVPDAVMGRLMKVRKPVRFHSGILTDSMVRLLLSQPVDDTNEVVAGMLIGTDTVYNYAHLNPRLSLRSTAYTHSQAVISRIDRFVSINSAVEVDLLGQVNAESVDGDQVAGVGGQVDFVRGARASKGGLSIIALPSSTRTSSRIVGTLQPGSPVTTSRVDVDVVVTEYGVAEMRHRTVRERVENLIRIAAPQYRSQLRESAARAVA